MHAFFKKAPVKLGDLKSCSTDAPATDTLASAAVASPPLQTPKQAVNESKKKASTLEKKAVEKAGLGPRGAGDEETLDIDSSPEPSAPEEAASGTQASLSMTPGADFMTPKVAPSLPPSCTPLPCHGPITITATTPATPTTTWGPRLGRWDGDRRHCATVPTLTVADPTARAPSLLSTVVLVGAQAQGEQKGGSGGCK
jgi:hypothetical protein